MITTILLTVTLLGQVAEPRPQLDTATVSARDAGIAWYADWDAGLAEAKRSQRPILLQFMRPACRGVSGVF